MPLNVIDGVPEELAESKGRCLRRDISGYDPRGADSRNDQHFNISLLRNHPSFLGQYCVSCFTPLTLIPILTLPRARNFFIPCTTER